jgi:hypothetical protein
MRKTIVILLAAAFVATATPALAELQNVMVGGDLRIRGNYYSNTVTSPGGAALRWPALNGVNWIPGRPVGTGFLTGNAPAGNGLGIFSPFSWDDDGNNSDYIEQRTRINFTADFTNEVSAFVEFESYDVWGEEFRSNYITGVDARQADANDDVVLYQGYIEAREMWGTPLTLRIGRQELSFGSEWLVGVNNGSSGFWGLSFDAARLTYATDMYSIDAFAATLAEGGVAEEDEDVWMYGIYGSYLGLEDITIDAYWLWVRDARSLNDTNFVWFVEWLENVFDVDDYDVTNLHTIGLRGAGTYGAFDFEAEVAYQFGDAGQVGFGFKPYLYGDDDADFGEFGVNLEVGYTFDTTWQPRLYLGYAYFGGEDERDLTFWEWGLGWWTQPEASVSFNRLFSNWEYTEFFANTDMSNVHIFRGGVNAMPTENVELLLAVSYFVADESFDSPVYWDFGGFRIPVAPALSFWTTENDDDLGWEVGLYATYHYTEDLEFSAGWAHLFTGDGLTDGQFSTGNGLVYTGGSDDDDADYLFFETKLSF